MRPAYLPLLILLGIMTSACSSLTTTKIHSTSKLRNISLIDSTLGFNIKGVTESEEGTSVQVVAVERIVQPREDFQRRFIEKRHLKPAVRAVLWLGGAAIAGSGYYMQDQTGLVRLGQLIIAGGGIIPLLGEITTASLPIKSESWRDERKLLTVRSKLAINSLVNLVAGNVAWTDMTNSEGNKDNVERIT